MASYTVETAKQQTLLGTTVDTVTINQAPRGSALTVYNQNTSIWMYFTYSAGGTAATPTSGGDDCIPVPPSSSATVRLDASLSSAGVRQGVQVKIIGNGNVYNVVVLPAVGR